MKKQRFNFDIQSALLLACFTFTLQACAGGYGNSAPASAPATSGTDNAAAQKADATQNVFKVVTGAAPVYSINDKENPAITLKRGVTYTFELGATEQRDIDDRCNKAQCAPHAVEFAPLLQQGARFIRGQISA